jgi:hypothetical protein
MNDTENRKSTEPKAVSLRRSVRWKTSSEVTKDKKREDKLMTCWMWYTPIILALGSWDRRIMSLKPAWAT